MVVQELEKETVHLVPGYVKILGGKELTQYFITDKPESPTLTYKNQGRIHVN